MTNPEFLDDPITATGTIDDQGQVSVQSFTWQEQQYPVVTMGRQWVDEAGRHLLVETAGGDRFELLLRRRDLIWSVQRVWRAQFRA
jgi:hypothetical protein